MKAKIGDYIIYHREDVLPSGHRSFWEVTAVTEESVGVKWIWSDYECSTQDVVSKTHVS